MMSAAIGRKTTNMDLSPSTTSTPRKTPALGLNAKRVIGKRYSLKDAKGQAIEEWPDIVRRVVGHVSAAEKDSVKRDEFFTAMSEVMLAASACRTSITETYQTGGTPPVANGWGCETTAPTRYTASVLTDANGVITVTLGTGIGGGLILNGELYSGFNHTAGEIGHMVIDVNGPKCGCGNKGCFEALASRTAIFQRIKAGVKDGEKTLLTEMLGDGLEDMRSGDLRKAIRRGDKFAAKVVEQVAEYIGIGVANLVNILGPDVVVLGGGLMDALEDEMMPVVVESAREHAFPGSDKGIKILPSKLGDDAGITGGAVLARRETK